MRHAILGDIHANFHALEAVIRDAKDQGCTAFHSLGDIVGYNARPTECVDLVRGLGGVCVLGNHDEAAAGEGSLGNFSEGAAASLLWTRGMLDLERRQWLGSLRAVRQLRGITLVHATLDTPLSWGYVRSAEEAELSMVCQGTPLCFIGHTHIPRAYARGLGEIRPPWDEGWDLPTDRRILVNAGSVGQPRDGDPRAAYILFDEGENRLFLRRVEYDVAAAAAAVRSAGLPERTASRLLKAS
jgi:diadenosine tetraphosphatase ApaH/serine/threonine PP2A family protein phosphatase